MFFRHIFFLATLNLFLGIFTPRNVFGEDTEPMKYVEKIKNAISPALYARFGSNSKDYDRDFVKRLTSVRRNTSRRNDDEEYTWEEWVEVPSRFEVFYHDKFHDMNNRGHICISMQVSYKNAIKQIRHYFFIRALYIENKEYEIGYLTHEIIFRYQTMLELYHYIQKRYWHRKRSNIVPTSLIVYLYANILEDSQAIIHLCNMLHEVDAKFADNSGITQKYDSVFNDNVEESTIPPKITLAKDEALDRYLRMQKRQAAKKKRQGKRQRQMFMKYGTVKPPPKYKTKKSRYPLNYGWSLEDWPPKPSTKQ